MRRGFVGWIFLGIVLGFGGSLQLLAQAEMRDVIEMTVELGFDGFFRPGQWTPVRVELENNGDSLRGRVLLRPETSGRVLGNGFSAPVELPSGSRKSLELYIQARSFPDTVRVELLDDGGLVRASREVGLIDLRPQDQLYAVLTGPNNAPLSLTALHVGGARAEQAIGGIEDIPERAIGLAALDMLLLINSDGQRLSSGQRRALRRWVRGGGHLLITGGPQAQNTVAGLEGLLPLELHGSQALDDLRAIARYSGDYHSRLEQRSIVALGERTADATVLLAQEDGLPLILRRQLGAGIVDFLAADPTVEPLASWSGLSGLFRTLQATRPAQPSWRGGFRAAGWAAEAVATLPGLDLLPPIQMLCLFLLAYIALLGPLNYFLLSRLGKPGWGWVTVPLIILIFTGLAWWLGFDLRGSELIVSRMVFLEAFTSSEDARVQQMIGLLSPRRATYSLAPPPGYSLAVAGAAESSSLFANNSIQTATEIVQGDDFVAQNFTIDGGIFANFITGGHLPKPAISGSFSLRYKLDERGRMQPIYQGLLRNESDIVLRDAVVVGTGLVHRLDGDFAPGDTLALGAPELRAELADSAAQPNPLERSTGLTRFNQSPFSGSIVNRSMKDLQGERFLRSRGFLSAEGISERQAAREQAFLASFMTDRFRSTARGAGLYLLGWSDTWPRDLSIEGREWSSLDTALYIIELEVERHLPRETVTLTTEHFSWMTLQREGPSDNGPDEFTLYEGHSVEFLFTPLPGMALDTVQRLRVDVDRGGGYVQALDLQLYDWWRGRFVNFGYNAGATLELSAPQRYLGAGGSLRMRLSFEDGLGTARVHQIRVEQMGRYHTRE